MKPLQELVIEIHTINQKWWIGLEDGKPIERNRAELLMLTITEMAEAVEGIRKNLMDDKLPHRSMEEVEMADGYIRICDLIGGFGIPITPRFSTICKREAPGNKAARILSICHDICMARNSDYHLMYVLYGIEQYCVDFDLDLWSAIDEKNEFNRTREDHTAEARLGKHGKKF